RHPLAGLLRGQARTDREAAAERLGERHDVRLDAGTLIRKQLAGTPHAGLHFVENEQQGVLVGKLAQAAQKMVLRDAHAAFTLDRLDQDRGGLRPDGLLHGFKIAERDLIEAVDNGAEAFEIFFVSGSRERRERTAVERALEGDDAVTLGTAVDGVELARGLDRAFHRLRAGILEKHVVGKALLAQPVRELLLLGNPKQVGDVDRLMGLRGDRVRDLRMRVAERIDGNARGEVEIARAVGGVEPHTLPPLEAQVDTREGRQQMSGAHDTFLGPSLYMASPEMKCAASDRKSTRLNSSHSQISYAVFCLKKKNRKSILRCKH